MHLVLVSGGGYFLIEMPHQKYSGTMGVIGLYYCPAASRVRDITRAELVTDAGRRKYAWKECERVACFFTENIV
jgi:hypothetical protein